MILSLKNENSIYTLKYKISFGLSVGLFALFCVFLFGVIIKAIKGISKVLPPKSVVTSGLNKRSKVYSILYFFHYFFIRMFLSLMVLLTPFVNPKILWIIILVV